MKQETLCATLHRQIHKLLRLKKTTLMDSHEAKKTLCATLHRQIHKLLRLKKTTLMDRHEARNALRDATSTDTQVITPQKNNFNGWP